VARAIRAEELIRDIRAAHDDAAGGHRPEDDLPLRGRQVARVRVVIELARAERVPEGYAQKRGAHAEGAPRRGVAEVRLLAPRDDVVDPLLVTRGCVEVELVVELLAALVEAREPLVLAGLEDAIVLREPLRVPRDVDLERLPVGLDVRGGGLAREQAAGDDEREGEAGGSVHPDSVRFRAL
jgi:hypothetical protein